MEQKLLHKMFNGEATDNELTQIRQWVNADKMNRETFYHERALLSPYSYYITFRYSPLKVSSQK